MRLPLIATLLATPALPATAQELSKPQPVPFENRIPEPRDVPFPGTVKLDVDATDTVQGIFRVKETITGVTPGPMTLLYPKWLPGAHSPRGEIEKLAGLVVRANGKRLEWTRDPVDVFAFHIDVPAGAKQLDIETADGDTELMLFARKRIACTKGAELLEPFRSSDTSKTRRMVASCCATPMYMAFDDKRPWVSVYRATFGVKAPPVTMRICTRFSKAPLAPRAGVLSHPGYPPQMMLRLLSAGIATLFTRPMGALP